MRRRGVRLSDREISNARSFEGELSAAYLKTCFFVTLSDPARPVTSPFSPTSTMPSLWTWGTGFWSCVHRRFQRWCEQEVLRQILIEVANALREQGFIDQREAFIDATFAAAKGGGDEIGPTKRGKGVKILAIVDRRGPAVVGQHPSTK